MLSEQQDMTPRQVFHQLMHDKKRYAQLVSQLFHYDMPSMHPLEIQMASLGEILQGECVATSWTITITVDFIVEWDF